MAASASCSQRRVPWCIAARRGVPVALRARSGGAMAAGQAVPLAGAATCSAACTTCWSGASIAVGPPGIGTNQMCIIGGVTRFRDPAGHVELAELTTPTTPSDLLTHRLVWTCHWVRQPPGWGVGPPGEVMYIAATSTAPLGVLAYTRDCGSVRSRTGPPSRVAQ